MDCMLFSAVRQLKMKKGGSWRGKGKSSGGMCGDQLLDTNAGRMML